MYRFFDIFYRIFMVSHVLNRHRHYGQHKGQSDDASVTNAGGCGGCLKFFFYFVIASLVYTVFMKLVSSPLGIIALVFVIVLVASYFLYAQIYHYKHGKP